MRIYSNDYFFSLFVIIDFFSVCGDYIRLKNESLSRSQHIYVHVLPIVFYTDSLPNFNIY
jgi:hypothetical protein